MTVIPILQIESISRKYGLMNDDQLSKLRSVLYGDTRYRPSRNPAQKKKCSGIVMEHTRTTSRVEIVSGGLHVRTLVSTVYFALAKRDALQDPPVPFDNEEGTYEDTTHVPYILGATRSHAMQGTLASIMVGSLIIDATGADRICRELIAHINKSNDTKFVELVGKEITDAYASFGDGANNGMLGSCMSGTKSTYTEIYSRNPEVCSMAVIKRGGKNVARGLLWKAKLRTKDNEQDTLFYDRIYVLPGFTESDAVAVLKDKWPKIKPLRSNVEGLAWIVLQLPIETGFTPYFDGWPQGMRLNAKEIVLMQGGDNTSMKAFVEGEFGMKMSLIPMNSTGGGPFITDRNCLVCRKHSGDFDKSYKMFPPGSQMIRCVCPTCKETKLETADNGITVSKENVYPASNGKRFGTYIQPIVGHRIHVDDDLWVFVKNLDDTIKSNHVWCLRHEAYVGSDEMLCYGKPKGSVQPDVVYVDRNLKPINVAGELTLSFRPVPYYIKGVGKVLFASATEAAAYFDRTLNEATVPA